MGRIVTRSALLALPVLFAGGCASTAFEGQRNLVQRQLDQAEEAGASGSAVGEVRETVELARSMEERAAADQKVAQEDLAWARQELPAAGSRIVEAERDRADAQDELARVQTKLQGIESERADLLSRGITADQAESIIGVRHGLLLRQVAELEAQIEALTQRIELARIDEQTAQQYREAAESRLKAAQERVTLAGVLYRLADEQARTLEAQALRSQRGELMQRITPPGQPPPPSAPPPVPTSNEAAPPPRTD